jgi:hypothetical protein
MFQAARQRIITCLSDWGDGSGQDSSSGQVNLTGTRQAGDIAGAVTATHTYLQIGTYTANGSILDAGGASARVSSTVILMWERQHGSQLRDNHPGGRTARLLATG